MLTFQTSTPGGLLGHLGWPSGPQSTPKIARNTIFSISTIILMHTGRMTSIPVTNFKKKSENGGYPPKKVGGTPHFAVLYPTVLLSTTFYPELFLRNPINHQ